MDKYDSRPSTLEHTGLVEHHLTVIATWLVARAADHDASKLVSPEKEMFDIFRPKLDSMSIDSPEYKQVLVDMGETLKHHYAENRHHPEHFENGISGMNILDLTEMICDWSAAAFKNGKKVNMEWACKRFGIEQGGHLFHIIKNTLELLE